jgi:hypothetical protein
LNDAAIELAQDDCTEAFNKLTNAARFYGSALCVEDNPVLQKDLESVEEAFRAQCIRPRKTRG